MKKRYMLLIVVAMMSLSACHKESDVMAHRVVVDQIGRSVEIKKDLQRVVSVYYLTTSATMILGKQDTLVGIENSIGSWGSLYSLVAPELYDLPSVGSLKGINIEEIMRLEPDLVILPLKLKDVLETLERVGLSVIVIDPETPESYEAMLLLLGQVFGEEEKAQRLVAYYQEKRAMIQERLANVTSHPLVYLSGSTPFSTVPRYMYQHDLMIMAHAGNLTGNIEGDYWVTISPEQLVFWDPDIWLIVPYAKYTIEELRENPQLRYLDVVKEDKIFLFPSLIEPWDYPTSSSILGLLWLSSLLHPESYSYEEFLAEAQNFFLEFYNLSLDASDMGV